MGFSQLAVTFLIIEDFGVSEGLFKFKVFAFKAFKFGKHGVLGAI